MPRKGRKLDDLQTKEMRAKQNESRKKRLTLKEEQFAVKYVENKGNGTKTALEVYDTNSENVAGNLASDNIRKPKIRDKIKEILAGVEEQSRKVVLDGLKATAQSQYEGEVFNSDLPDYSERRKMLSLVADLAGWKAPKQIESQSLHITAKYEGMSEEALQQLLREQMSELAGAKG